MAYAPRTAAGRLLHGFEEGVIAVLLGAMTILTFANVVFRYVFQSMIIWGLEAVTILFAWLVLFGIAYGFKIGAHLGVDAVLNVVSPRLRRAMGLLTGVLSILYALLILKGAWDYWAPFAGLPQTTGRWLPTGLDHATRSRAYFETDQIPMPGAFRWLQGAINDGDAYEKLPRVVPYVILPLAALLMLWRLIEATAAICTGRADSLIVSHEAEDAVADVKLQEEA